MSPTTSPTGGEALLRDFGKVLGFDGPEIDRLRELLWHSSGEGLAERLQSLPELRALNLDPETYGDLFALCGQLARNPRHLGTHSSGIIVSDVPVCEVAPVVWAGKGVPIVALDKDDVESPGIGFLKLDQLCLRALTAVDIATTRLKAADPDFDYATRDREDPETLAMIRAAETVGVFQLESPAQMALQWRLKADRFDDLVHAVALIRPGPLVGGGVGPYVAVRHGKVKPRYPLPELAPILHETCGRILFQDQVLEVVKVVGGFSADEADKFLKFMTHARSKDEMGMLGRELRERAKAANGIGFRDFARLWKQIEGFSRYGFCHGHSIAFADHAQGTAWLLRHHPAEFLAAVLSVEPCGFWPIETVVGEAKRRGVEVLGPCLNRSGATLWQVDNGLSIRCPLSFVQGVTEAVAEGIIMEREVSGPFVDLASACRRFAFVPRETLEWLVLAGALDCLAPSRRRAIWSLPALHRPPETKRVTAPGTGARRFMPGQKALEVTLVPSLPPELPDFADAEREAQERRALGFSPGGHPMRRLREGLQARGVSPCGSLQQFRNGASVTLAGLSIHPHRPPVPSGEIVVFLTLEDESGMAQSPCRPRSTRLAGSPSSPSRCCSSKGRWQGGARGISSSPGA